MLIPQDFIHRLKKPRTNQMEPHESTAEEVSIESSHHTVFLSRNGEVIIHLQWIVGITNSRAKAGGGGTTSRLGLGAYFLLSRCCWRLRAPTPLQSILWPIIVTLGQICNFRNPNLVTFYLCINLILNEEQFTFRLQYKHSGTFAKRKYEELSYPKNQKMCGPIQVTL